MKFKIANDEVYKRVDGKFLGAELMFHEIITPILIGRSTFEEPHLMYRVRYENGILPSETFVRVSAKPVNNEYLLYFNSNSMVLEGQTLIDFMEYLRKNHKRNVTELSI